jgi:predicted RND superfamily exporter protein
MRQSDNLTSAAYFNCKSTSFAQTHQSAGFSHYWKSEAACVTILMFGAKGQRRDILPDSQATGRGQSRKLGKFSSPQVNGMNGEDPLRARYLRRFRLGILLLLALALPAAFHSHAAISSLFNRPGDWVPDSLPAKQEFNDFLDHFAIAELIMVGWEESELGAPSLDLAADLLRPICKANYDPETDDATLAKLPIWAAERIVEIRDHCGSPTPLEWVRTGTETLDRLTSSPVSLTRASAIRRLQGSLVGSDGKQTCLLVSMNENGMQGRRMLIPAIREMIGNVTGRDSGQIAVVGGPFEGAVVDAESIRTIRTFAPPSALIAIFLCLICLRSVPLTGSIVAVAVIGQGLVLATVYYMGTPMNAILIVLPPLVFVLTVSAGIHLSNYYLDAAGEFPDLSRAEAAQRAMKAGTAPCCLAAGTTVIGLSSLLLVRLEPVRIFGGVAAIGVILTLFLLLLLLPGAMVLTKPFRKPAHESDAAHAGLVRWGRNWMRQRLVRPWPLILSFLITSIILSLGLTRLESTVNVPRMFLPDSDIRRQYAWFEEQIGPTVTGELLITFPPFDEDDDPLERLAIVALAHRHALEQEVVGGAISAMTFVPSMPRRRSLSATATRSVVRKLIRDPESSLGKLGFIARDDKSEIWRISVRIPQQPNSDFGEEIVTIRDSVANRLAEVDIPVKVSFTGSIVIVQRAQEILLRDLFRSFVMAFGIIAVVMMLMLRSIRGGLIAMAPNLFPTILLFGLMGLMRIPLDIGSVMSASVALGIAVDDTVHLLSRFGSQRARGLGQIQAAFGALTQCGWAMMQTTLVCGASLMAYYFSDFVPTSRFSLFMFALLASALVGVIFLLPTMMASSLGRWLSYTIGASPDAAVFADRDGEQDSDQPQDARRLPSRWQTSLPPAPTATSEGDPPQQDSTIP